MNALPIVGTYYMLNIKSFSWSMNAKHMLNVCVLKVLSLLPSSGSVGYSAQRLPRVFSLPGHYCPLDRNLCDVSRRSQVSV